MSDISITGNEAQFNENVTFLKNVDINGELFLPNQELTLNKLNVLDINGTTNLNITGSSIVISGVTTFLDNVFFQDPLSFPKLEIRDSLQVGFGGTVLTADTSLNPGKVGIGSTQPTELLDVFGKAKILDLDLRNLNVAGFSTFNNNIDVNANVDISGFVSIGQTLGVTKEVTIGNSLDVIGLSTFHSNVKLAGAANLEIVGDGPQSIILKDGEASGIQISYQTTPDEFTIEKQVDGSKFFLAGRDDGRVELYNSDVKRLETTGVGITVFGDIIVPDVGIRTSRVGLGTTNPVYITSLLNDPIEGPLRLGIDGSVAITRNIYDSAGSPGINGFFLKRDERGIRWVSITPEFSEGIFLQNEGTQVPSPGVAQSFTTVNFAQQNSFGTGTDNITATAQNSATPTGLATVFTQDFWGFEGNNIYRMSNVGIGSSAPNVKLDVLGDSKFVGVTTFAGDVFVENDFDVDGQTDLDILNVSDTATFAGDIDANANLDVDGQTDLDVLNVAELATFAGIATFNSQIFTNKISNLGIITSNIIHLTGDTFSTPVQSPGDTESDAAIIVNENFHIYTLEEDGRRLRNLIEKTSDKITIGQQNTELINSIELKPGGDGTIRLHYGGSTDNVRFETSGIGATVYGQLDTNDLNVSGVSTFVGLSTFSSNVFVEATTDTNQLNVSGVSTFQDDIFVGVGATVGFGTTAYFRDNAKAVFGDNENLEIYFNGDNSVIRDQGAGALVIQGQDVSIQDIDNNATMALFTQNGSVDLHFNASKKIETTNEGILVSGGTTTGDFRATGVSTFQDDIFIGVGATVGFGTTAYFRDNAKAVFGDDENLAIYFNGNNSIIEDQGSGNTILSTNGNGVFITKNNGSASIADFRTDESVILYHDGNEKFKTTNEGILVSGGTTTGDFKATGVSTFVGLSTFSSNIFVEATTDTDQLNVSGVSTFVGIATFKDEVGIAKTLSLQSRISDRNNDVGTTVAENLSNAITNAVYNSTTGIMVITIADHGFANGDSIQIPDGTIILSCNYKGVTINQSYPRSKDPNSGKWLVISNVTTNTFQVDVGDGGLAAGITHNFVSASGGVLHSSGQYVEYDYRLASVGTGVSWRPSGVQTKRTIWVSKSGSDSNSGLLEGDAKATIGGAAAIAVETDTIKIRPGLYIENNPVGLRTDVSVTGEDLRLVTVQSKNKNKDVFHVRRGCLIENLNFGGSNVGVSHAGAACVAFPTPAGADSAVTGYTAPGPATAGPSGRWRSPYVRNCTNFMTDSIGLKVDGDNATASTVGGDLKSMVVDSYTQYNENGIGVSLTNNGYAQLVSIFTISCDIGIFASSGAQCDLTNSNSSFGNFGLVAVGLGSTQFTGIVSNTNVAGDLIGSTNAEGQDTVVCANVRDLDGIARRPFDGQSLYFKINTNNYPDVNLNNLNSGTLDGDGRIKQPLQQLRSINLIATGSDLQGFSPIDPPSVLIRDADGEVEPKGPQGIIAEAVADVDATGTLVGIDVIAQGRSYFAGQNIVVDVEGNIGIATAVMEPIFFTVESSTENPIGSIGIATITFNEFIPYELFPDDPFSLQRISRILTSSHSFEYVGAGTDINISTPLQGAIPIKANEIVAKDGAQIPFTSTDQQGNFDIGQGLQINQTTSSISGRDFSRSIQAQVTPLILALR